MNKDIIATLELSVKSYGRLMLSNTGTLPEVTLPDGTVIAKIEGCLFTIQLNKGDHNDIIKFNTSDNYIFIDPIDENALYDAFIEIYVEKDDIRIVDFLHGTSRDLINNGSNIHEHIKTRLESLIGNMYNHHHLIMKIRTQSVHYQPQPT